MMNELFFRELLERHLVGELDTAGKQQLAAALQLPEYQAIMEAIVSETFLSGAYSLPETPALQERLTSLLETKTGLSLRPVAKRRMLSVYKWVAAAAVIVVLVITALLFRQEKQPEKPLVAKRSNTSVPPQQKRFKNEVPPGRNSAVLTLADGRNLMLDTLKDGVIVTETGMEIHKLNGQVTYRLSPLFKQKNSGELVYNDIHTVAGNQYQLLLSDGTRVYLNAHSSIRYPLAFTGTDRTVAVTGEVYFEVAQDARQPFRVKLPDHSVVDVLGTHFNVNTYHVNSSHTTLVEGAIRLSRGKEQATLTPGESGSFDTNGQVVIAAQVNTEKTTAWVNHEFYFENDSLEEVMEQVCRWYGTTVVYKGHTEERFTGIIGRDVGLTQVLAMFENTGHIHFTIEDKTITVLQE